MTLPDIQPIKYLNGQSVEVAPKKPLPSTSFAAIEFPAILSNRPYLHNNNDEHPSLTKALESLSPLPVGYASSASALKNLARLIGQEEDRLIECKLAFACDPNAPSSSKSAPSIHPRSTNAMFRHPISGEVVDVHNVVCQIKKRIWKRKRADGTVEIRKEYTADALGVTHSVARFRSMPDYVFDPGLMVDPSKKEELEVAPSIALHDYLRQMDVEGIRSFQLDEEKEDYEINVEGHGKTSNIRMPPPSLFDRTEYPQAYGFRQNPTSRLLPFGTPDTNGRTPMRYVNRQKYRELAPIQFGIHSFSKEPKKVPTEPLQAVKEHKFPNDALLEKVKQMASERPMWSRRALFNQFPPEERRMVRNFRPYVSRIFYTITDGCWRDNLVKFGYDPRADKRARFYQRMGFQRMNRLEVDSEGEEAGEGNSRANVNEEGNNSVENANPSNIAEQYTIPAGEADDRSHIFDGVTVKKDAGTFMLIDVEDPIVRELIYAEGEGVLGDSVSPTSGWYTPKHYQKIHNVLEHRMSVLMKTGKPATRESCEEIMRR